MRIINGVHCVELEEAVLLRINNVCDIERGAVRDGLRGAGTRDEVKGVWLETEQQERGKTDLRC